MRSLLFVLLLVVAAHSQTPDPATPKPAAPVPASRAIWRCNLPGGVYEIVIPAMVSVSSHEYVVDGVARVTELNVDTQGSLSVRFYYLEPLAAAGPAGVGAATIGKVQSALTEAADRSVGDAWRKVVKNYPATTHAKTVEFRIADKETLTRILNSASKSLRTGVPDEITIAP